jgi:hypothetical protein
MFRNGVSYRRLKVETMKTTFAKLTKHTPVNGWMAICQRDSRPFGIVGTKF